MPSAPGGPPCATPTDPHRPTTHRQGSHHDHSQSRPQATAVPTPKKLSPLSVVGYGAGDAANNLAFTTATMFLLVYYTDVAGISAAAAGTLLLVVRVFDAFADIFAGRVVDRTYSKRFGKFRPFILFGSLPLLLLSVATFSVPQIGESGMLHLRVPHLCGARPGLQPREHPLRIARRRDDAQRGGAGEARQRPHGRRRARRGRARHLRRPADHARPRSAVAVHLHDPRVRRRRLRASTSSRSSPRRRPSSATCRGSSMRQSFAILKSNRPLLMLCLSSFVFLTGMLALSTVQLYYLRDVLHALPLYAVLSMVQIVAGLRARGVRADDRPALRQAQRLHRRRRRHDRGRPHGLPRPAERRRGSPSRGSSSARWASHSSTCSSGRWRPTPSSTASGRPASAPRASSTRCSPSPARPVRPSAARSPRTPSLSAATPPAPRCSPSPRSGASAPPPGSCPLSRALIAIVIMFFYPLTDARHRQIVAEIAERREDEGSWSCGRSVAQHRRVPRHRPAVRPRAVARVIRPSRIDSTERHSNDHRQG